MPSMEPLKLGLLSTANIAFTVLEGLQSVPTCVCTAVASRSLAKAQRYAADHSIPTACTYEHLLQQPIDAVYIPLPTALATDWAVRCASAGFHVLVDKPFASAADVQRIIDACSQNSVFFMDATHFVHASRTALVKDHIRAGLLGDIRRIVSIFTVPIAMKGNIRADPVLEPMGALGDLGWYVMRTAVTFFGLKLASNIVSISCEGKYHPHHPDIIESAEGVVLFGSESERVSLNFIIDCSSSMRQNALIIGSMAQLEIPDFMAPAAQTDLWRAERKPEDYSTDTEIITVKTVSSFDDSGDPVKCYPEKQVQLIQEPDGLSQVSLMMREFSRMIREKDSAAAKQWASESLATQTLVDAAFEEIKKKKA